MPRGRKPADQEVVGGVLLRQRVYNAMREHAPGWLTVTEIASRAHAHPAAVESYVHALRLAGLAESLEDAEARWAREHLQPYMSLALGDESYRLTSDTGAEAPQVTKGGAIIEGLTAQEAIWKAARVFRRFTWSDIAAAVSSDERPVAPATVKAYLSDLHAAGYLSKAQVSRPGMPTAWQLRSDRDTGPRAPMVQRTKQVFDPNLGKVVHRVTDAEPIALPEAARDS